MEEMTDRDLARIMISQDLPEITQSLISYLLAIKTLENRQDKFRQVTGAVFRASDAIELPLLLTVWESTIPGLPRRPTATINWQALRDVRNLGAGILINLDGQLSRAPR